MQLRHKGGIIPKINRAFFCVPNTSNTPVQEEKGGAETFHVSKG